MFENIWSFETATVNLKIFMGCVLKITEYWQLGEALRKMLLHGFMKRSYLYLRVYVVYMENEYWR